MTAPTEMALGTRREPSRSPARIVLGRRALLSGAMGLAVGAAFPPSMVSAAPGPAVGATIYSYGHSYTMMPSPYVTRQFFDEYQLDLGRRLKSGPVISRGRSATRLLDTISAIIAPVFAASTTRRWQIGDKGIVLLENMMNDVSGQVGGSPDYLNAYEKALRLALGVFGARTFLHADEGMKVGEGWAVKADDRVEQGRTWHTQTSGDTISFVITGGDSVHISTLCTDAAVLTQGTLQAECNGMTLGSFGRSPDNGTHVCNRGESYKSSVGGVVSQWTPAGWRVTGMNAAAGTSGTKTLVLRKVDDNAEPVWVQGVYPTSGRAPPVFVAKEPPRNPGGASQAAVAAFYANQGAYRALIDAVCDEYSWAVSVDLTPGWDNTTMVSALDTGSRFHPNTLGMSCIADNFERAINAYLRAGDPACTELAAPVEPTRPDGDTIRRMTSELLPHPVTGQLFASPVPPGTGWPGDPATPASPVARTARQVERLAGRAGSIAELDAAVSVCRACPRLVQWRETVATEGKRASFADQPYWGRPTPGFGDNQPEILVVGLAPAANGGNRTGRMFTGDRSGDWIYAGLHRAGYASQPTSMHSGDGLSLSGVRIVAAVRCAPPANKPDPVERHTCGHWLDRDLALAEPGLRSMLALGAIGWVATLASARRLGWAVPRPGTRFAHGAETTLVTNSGRSVRLLGSYHVSQQNTFTGKLTEAMLDEVLARL